MSKVTHIQLPIAIAKDLLEKIGGLPTSAGWGTYYDGLIAAMAQTAQEHTQIVVTKAKRGPKAIAAPVTKPAANPVAKPVAKPVKPKAAPKEDKRMKIARSPEAAPELAPIAVADATTAGAPDSKTKRRDYMRARRAAKKLATN